MRVVIAGPFSYGTPAANAIRVRGLVAALLLGGHEVSVVDLGKADGGASATVPVTTIDEYGGLLSRISAGARGLFIGDRSAAWVRDQPKRPDCVILYGTHSGYFLRFRRLCRSWGIPLIADVVEWYQPEDLPGGRFGVYAAANEFSMRHLLRTADGILAISERLEAHFRGLGCRVHRLPPLFEPLPAPASKWSEADGRLHLCYAGTPGRKEALDETLDALQAWADQGAAFTLHVVGMTDADLASTAGRRGAAFASAGSSRAIFYGRVPNSEARRIVAGADYTLLLRPLRKANQFGFPSKFAESMSLGTPVIANDFSDLSQFIVDGESGYLIPSLAPDAIDQALARALDGSVDQRREMARRALSDAERWFSPAAHRQGFSDFLRKVASPDGQKSASGRV